MQRLGVVCLIMVIALGCSASVPTQRSRSLTRAQAPAWDRRTPAPQQLQGKSENENNPPATNAVTASAGNGLYEPSFPNDPSLEIVAELVPKCVEPGAAIKLTVSAQPGLSVAFNAIYAGNKSGAIPPFGSGYGGNDQGPTDSKGRFESAWVVSKQAPMGEGRVEVIAAASDGRRSYRGVPFRLDHDCP